MRNERFDLMGKKFNLIERQHRLTVALRKV